MGVVERIKEFQEAEGLSNYALEKKLGLANGYMRKCQNPTCEIIYNLLRLYPNLSAEWLLRGEGTMLRELEQTTSSKLDEALNDNNMISEILNKMNVEELVRREIQKQLSKKA